MEMHEKFGFYREKLISLTMQGKDGAEEIAKMMESFRTNPPENLAGSKVAKVFDYQNSTAKDLKSGTVDKLDFQKSNVLQFLTDDGTKVSARPSGTEPKIKFYFSVNKDYDGSDYNNSEMELDQKIDRIIKDLNLN
jgi:phosphoglucomutase